MEVLLFQLGIAAIIIIAGLFGKIARNTITILVVIFTAVMVFTSGLMILQFITIGISFFISKSITSKKDKHSDNDSSCMERIGCAMLALFAILFLLAIISAWLET